MTYIVLCIKGFVSATYHRSSSGDNVGLLNRTTCPTVVVSDWWTTDLAHSWWVSIQIIIIGSIFFFPFIGREPTTWHKGLRVWMQIIFSSCVKETTLFSFLRSLLRENGTSLSFLRIFIKKQTWWSNDKTIIIIIIAKYRDSASANNWSARTDKSRYPAQPRPIFVNCWQYCSLSGPFWWRSAAMLCRIVIVQSDDQYL